MREDPLLMLLAGSAEPENRLAGKSALNRLELAGEAGAEDRYKKVHYEAVAIDKLLVNIFVEAHAEPPQEIVIDLDSGFCRDALINWCESNRIDYLFGFARNERLRRIVEPQMQQATALYRQASQAARVFTDFAYETNDSGSRARRVVAKAEHLAGKENPRYLVTSLSNTNKLTKPSDKVDDSKRHRAKQCRAVPQSLQSVRRP